MMGMVRIMSVAIFPHLRGSDHVDARSGEHVSINFPEPHLPFL